MEQFKRVMNKLLFPHLIVILISVPIAAVLLGYTFLLGQEESPIAYISYVFSAYATTIACIRIAKVIKVMKGKFRDILHSNKYMHRYLTDVPFKTYVSLYLSLGFNLVFVAMKLFYGIYYRSVWFATLAVYYSMLAMMHFLLLRYVNRNGIGTKMISEWKHYRLCGIILMMMNSALAGVVILVVSKNEGFHYPGYLIYVVALYAFYNIITAVRNVIKYREYNSPVMSAAKAVKLVAALVSMLSLETAMLMQFDIENNPPFFRQIMTASTGVFICAFVLVMAVVMIGRSAKQLQELRNEGIRS